MSISLKERIEDLRKVYGDGPLEILRPFTDVELVLEPVPSDEAAFELWASSQNIHMLDSVRRGWDGDVREYVGMATHVVYLSGNKVGYERLDST